MVCPLMEAVDLPLGYKSGMATTIIANAVYEKFNPKELDDVKVMYLHAYGSGLLFTKDKPVSKMEDLKGMKIRSHGTTAKVVKALGGIPVTMPMPELYQSLQKGVVDGAIYPIEVKACPVIFKTSLWKSIKSGLLNTGKPGMQVMLKAKNLRFQRVAN